MRVLLKVLTPGVEHAEEADLRAEMLGIGGNLQQGRGAGAEQQVVDDSSCSAEPASESSCGKREDDMDVRTGSSSLAAIGEPLVASVGLALWAMAVAAGVVRDGLMAACESSDPDGRRALPCGNARWRTARGDAARSTRTGSSR